MVIVGPGAMGCLFAGFLARAGHPVTLLDRDAARADALGAGGVHVETPAGSFHAPVRATASARGLATADWLCVCVKTYDTHDAIRAALPLVGRRTGVVSIQNGLGAALSIAAQTGPGPVLCTVTWQGATLLAPGRVRHAGFGPTLVGPLMPGALARAGAFAGLLAAAGFEARATDNTAGAVWSKLIVNAAINPVTAVWGIANGDLPSHPEAREAAMGAAREGERVARAKGVTLLYADAWAEALAQCERSRANLSSMLQDVRRGRPTEIDAINGAIVREAEAIDLDAPVNRMLVERVKASAAGR